MTVTIPLVESAQIRRLCDRVVPDTDTITLAEYRRRLSVPPPSRPDDRPRCETCGRPYTPTFRGRRRQRFCSRPCLRWWHSGRGANQRKQVAS